MDRAVLIALYNATDGPYWKKNEGWLSDAPLGEWHGVTTDATGGVIALNLSTNLLSGEIPTELGNLSNLTSLNLADNQLSGEIPVELGNLSNLTELFLLANPLSGCIPASLLYPLDDRGRSELRSRGTAFCPEPDRAALIALYNATGGLEWRESEGWRSRDPVPGNPIGAWDGVTTDDKGYVIELELKDLSGAIPAELGNLSNLTGLWLRGDLSGAIPAELGNLTNLTYLNLSGDLSGEIPAELGNLTNLTELSLRGNQLSGEIPGELGNLSNLTTLGLFENQLSGEIPGELGNLTNLEWLLLYGNQLSGEIPAELGNLTNLEWLLLGTNGLSGGIPAELGNLSNLTKLELYGNQLSGEIPAELDNWLKSLEQVNLAGNQFNFVDQENECLKVSVKGRLDPYAFGVRKWCE